MLVVSVGMPKSGSAFCFNLTNDMLVAAGYSDARQIRSQYGLHAHLMHKNCLMHYLNRAPLEAISGPLEDGHTFAIRSHGPPTPYLLSMVENGEAKVTYVYRHPFDVVVSMIEYGARKRARGDFENNFSKYEDVYKAVPHVKNWLGLWERWARSDKILRIEYEKLVENCIAQLERLATFINLNVSGGDLRKIADRYNKENLVRNGIDYINFNKGIVGRYKNALNSEEIAFLQEQLGHYLPKMGYA